MPRGYSMPRGYAIGRRWMPRGYGMPRGYAIGSLWMPRGYSMPRDYAIGRLWMPRGYSMPRYYAIGRLWMPRGYGMPRDYAIGRLWMPRGAAEVVTRHGVKTGIPNERPPAGSRTTDHVTATHRCTPLHARYTPLHGRYTVVARSLHCRFMQAQHSPRPGAVATLSARIASTSYSSSAGTGSSIRSSREPPCSS